jgi:hypothetical protein
MAKTEKDDTEKTLVISSAFRYDKQRRLNSTRPLTLMENTTQQCHTTTQQQQRKWTYVPVGNRLGINTR